MLVRKTKKHTPITNDPLPTPIIAGTHTPAPFAWETHSAGGRVGGVGSATGRGLRYASAAGFVGSHYAHCWFVGWGGWVDG